MDVRVFKLDVPKTVQAIAVILRATNRDCLEYLSILKLLYIADRESWRDRGTSITGDVPVAMKNGPVLSGVHDLINLNTEQWLAHWVNYLHREDYDLQLKSDPGRERLSPYEVKKLEEVARRHEKDSWRDLTRITHELPEWQQNNPEERGLNVIPIPLDDILRAVGRGEDAEWIKQDAAEVVAMEQVLGR
jgi:hypothetical protein